jgi:hypothetical protein
MRTVNILNTDVDYSILVIATNKYIEFIPPLLKSVEEYLEGKEIDFVLFTDQLIEVEKWAFKSNKINLKTIEIPAFGWPDATLKRYEIFSKHWNESICGQVVIYLDADTLLVNPILKSDMQSESWVNGVALVAHPGYFNRNPILRMLIKFSRIGPWETNKKSAAYLPFLKRENYVCGGVWMGKNQYLKSMVDELYVQVCKDSENKLIAKWHDETHLNKWKSLNHVSVRTPVWAFANGYRNLTGLRPFIEVLEKTSSFKKS